MGSDAVRARLTAARDEVRAACEGPIAGDVEDRLSGLAEQLDYFADGCSTDPEATSRPAPGVLDSIEDHLSEVADAADDDAVAGHLDDAVGQLRRAIPAADGRAKGQREFPADR